MTTTEKDTKDEKDTKTELRYNAETGKMEQQAVSKKSPAAGWSRGDVTFIAKGEELNLLLKFAKEDGLDISTPMRRGQAINSYIRAAIAELGKIRQSKGGKSSTPAKTSNSSPTGEKAQPATSVKSGATKAP